MNSFRLEKGKRAQQPTVAVASHEGPFLLVWLFCCGSIFQQAGRSYYLFLNYMLFNYMYVRVFHPWNQAVIRVFHPNFTVWSPGVSSWKTPPDHRLLWIKPALRIL